MLLGITQLPLPAPLPAVIASGSACMAPVAMILTGFIIGGTRGIDTYEYHNTCAEAMLPLDGDTYIHVAPAGPADHVPYDEVEVFRVPKGTMVTLRPGVWHHGPFCVDTDSLQTLIILPERLYAYDCTVLTAPEADKLRIEA